jgi:hypothetical protein
MIDALPRLVIFAHCWCVRWQSSYERLKRKLLNANTKLAMDVYSMSPRIIFVDGVYADCTQALPSIDQCYSRVSVGRQRLRRDDTVEQAKIPFICLTGA